MYRNLLKKDRKKLFEIAKENISDINFLEQPKVISLDNSSSYDIKHVGSRNDNQGKLSLWKLKFEQVPIPLIITNEFKPENLIKEYINNSFLTSKKEINQFSIIGSNLYFVFYNIIENPNVHNYRFSTFFNATPFLPIDSHAGKNLSLIDIRAQLTNWIVHQVNKFIDNEKAPDPFKEFITNEAFPIEEDEHSILTESQYEELSRRLDTLVNVLYEHFHDDEIDKEKIKEDIEFLKKQSKGSIKRTVRGLILGDLFSRGTRIVQNHERLNEYYSIISDFVFNQLKLPPPS